MMATRGCAAGGMTLGDADGMTLGDADGMTLGDAWVCDAWGCG